MKKIGMIFGAVLIVGLIAAGSFWGGMTYQKNQADQIQQAFFNARGQPNGEQFPPNGQLPAGRQFPGNGQRGAVNFGGGTIGQVKSIDGNVLTLSTAQDVRTITLTESTQVEKTEIVGIDQLKPGMQVMISGETDSSGNLTASLIRVLSDALSRRFNPSATEMAP